MFSIETDDCRCCHPSWNAICVFGTQADISLYDPIRITDIFMEVLGPDAPTPVKLLK
jgi:hypothetical protein